MPNSDLRDRVTRTAHTLPAGSKLQQKLGDVLRRHARGYPAASEDMDGFLDALEADLLLPYPAIYNALGVEKNDLQIRSRIAPDGTGSIRFRTRGGTDLVFEVDPDGAVMVSGKINGEKIPAKKFPFRADSPGMHRGLQGDLVSYVSDNYPQTTFHYQVVGEGRPKVYKSEAELLRDYRQTGVNDRGRQELVGQPKLKGLAGPMWGGRKGDVAIIRYETWDMYERLSR